MNHLFFCFFSAIFGVQSQRMMKQLLSTSTIVVPLSENIRIYFRAYYNFKGMIITLP